MTRGKSRAASCANMRVSPIEGMAFVHFPMLPESCHMTSCDRPSDEPLRDADASLSEVGAPGELPLNHFPRAPGTQLCNSEDILGHLVGLVGPALTSEPVLWVIFLTPEQRVVPLVMPIDRLPRAPDSRCVELVVGVIEEVRAQFSPHAEVAIGIVRISGGDYGPDERLWARSLWAAADEKVVPLTVVAAIGRWRARVLDRASCTPRENSPCHEPQ
jgi:hypothetical protein